MNFMGMGFGELVFILIIAVIVLGPGKLPEVARALGKTMREFRSISDGFQSELRKELNDASSTVKDDAKPLSELSDSLSSIRDVLNPASTAATSQAKQVSGASGSTSEPDGNKKDSQVVDKEAPSGVGVSSSEGTRESDESSDSAQTHQRDTAGDESEGESDKTDTVAPQETEEMASSGSNDAQPVEFTPSDSSSVD